MNILIYSSLILSLFYFLLRNRVDFLLVFFISTVLYHWQIIYGTIIVPPYSFEVNDISKIIIMIVLITHLIITCIHDTINNKNVLINIHDLKSYNRIAYVLCFISLFLTIKALYIVGYQFTYKDEYKNALAENNISMIFTYYSSAMSLLFGILTRNRKLIILSFLPLINYAYMGYRALFVVAIIGSITISFYNTKLFSKKILKLTSIIILVFLFFSIQKVIYYEVKKTENFSLKNHVEKIISKDARYDNLNEYLKSIFFYSEFGQTSSNLTLSIDNELGKKYDFTTMLLGSIPFVKNFSDISEDDVRFSRLIRNYANPGFSYGLASNVWGEAYAALGFFGVFLFSIIVSSTISVLNSVFFRKNIFYLFNILFLSFLSFYIHRNDMTLIFAHIKNSVFLIICALLIVSFYQLFLKILKINLEKKNICE